MFFYYKYTYIYNFMKKILLFIPCFNCQKQIIRVLNSLDDKIVDKFEQILIIDNRSNDNTQEVIREFLENHKKKNSFKLIVNKENYSFGGSHKVAINYAKENKFSHILVLHGDDQANINDIMSNNLDKNLDYDCFMGSRFIRGSRAETYSNLKKFGNIIFNFAFSLFSKKKIYDLGSGLYVIKTSVFEDNKYIQFPDNLTFNYYLTLYMSKNNFNLKYFPISWREEDQVSNVKIIKQTLELLKILFLFIFNHEKLFNRINKRKLFPYEEIKL